MKKKVFISATSHGLKSYRELAREIFQAQGFDTEEQEHFDTDEVRSMLRKKIEGCDALISFVGSRFGEEAPITWEELTEAGLPMFEDNILKGHLSYTQYEVAYFLWYHEKLNRPHLVFVTDKDFEPDCASENSLCELPSLVSRQEQYQRWIMHSQNVRVNWRKFNTKLDVAKALAKLNFSKWREQ